MEFECKLEFDVVEVHLTFFFITIANDGSEISGLLEQIAMLFVSIGTEISCMSSENSRCNILNC